MNSPSPSDPPAEPETSGGPIGPVGTSSSNVTIVRRPAQGDSDPEAQDPSEGERIFHIIGTAHVSQASVEEVTRVIEEVKPDTVCVELCQTRYETLTDPDRWKKLDIFQVIKQRKMLFLMASLALQSYQRRIGEQLGVKPGAEMLAAIDTAERTGSKIVMADRDIQATLKRTWANLGFFSKLKLIGGLTGSIFGDEDDIDEQEIEALKDREHISDMMSEFARVMPQVKEPLIDERDLFLMSSIEDAPGKTIVAVVGAGHVEGMVKNVGSTVDREALSIIPPPSTFWRVAKWLVPMIILSAFYYGYQKHEFDGLVAMLKAWILPNAIGAGLFVALARGRMLSVLTAIIASPITSLNPTIGAGMFVGLVEAWLRKPTVEDCENLGTEVSTFGGMMKNPFSHILIVSIAAGLGSSLGAYVGFAWVASLL